MARYTIDDLDDLIMMIPEESENEALNSIQSMLRIPPTQFKVRCHLGNKFSLRIAISGSVISIYLEDNKKPRLTVTKETFLSGLKQCIYEVDEAIAQGTIKIEKSIYIIDRPPAPKHMDLPTWDEETQSYYDAEY